MSRPDGGGAGRFNSQHYLDEWKSAGTFPRIHDAIFNVAMAEMGPGPTLDLAGSTGLLGRRWKDTTGEPVVGADQDADAIARGTAAGVYGEDLPVLQVDLGPDTVDGFLEWLSGHGVKNVLARRCLCVVSEHLDLARLRDGWADIGVTDIVLEGQTQSSRAVHPFGHADRQVEALAPAYLVAAPPVGHVRYLRRT